MARARQVEFEGMVNFRDLGGLPANGGKIRPGRLFRSDSVAYASAADVTRLVEERGDLLVSLLRRLALPEALPALIHCEAGCDRTGVVTATVLALLGVPDDEICADYAHTATAVPAINARSREIARKHGLSIPDGYSDETFMPTFEVMEETLKRMRQRWTDVTGWAKEYGLTSAEIDALRAALVA